MYLCSKNKKDMAYKKGQDRRQRVLFPDCIDEYVEAAAPVRLFDAFVDNLKMNELGFVRSTPAETGTPGYDPRDLLKLLTAVLLITQEELQIAVAQEPGIIKYSLVMMNLLIRHRLAVTLGIVAFRNF